jgi:molybdenum cofactor cytidylyltransferase
MKIEAIVISAGYSSRMNDFKPLMKFEGLPFILQVILKLSDCCDKVHVVTGYRSEDIKEVLTEWFQRSPETAWFEKIGGSKNEWSSLLKKVKYIYNPNFEQGMFSSLKSGLFSCQDAEWILYHFVDQPHIPKEFYNSFIRQISDNFNWIQPCYQQRRGHPLLFHQSLFPEILQADSFSSLYQISQNSAIKKKLWDCPFPQILQNFNSPSDLQPGE